ncbi:MAG TPA: hypothetical protein VGS07_17965 [Thermoanaerobaculia bacterium]|jgi:hypothetical protein|nr:hypothetical protein [Thermoanaerobaculia bacterium]
MLSYLLTSATAEHLKAILQRAGLAILTQGGRDELARFFVSERGRLPDHLVFICLLESREELDEIQDRPLGTLEGLPASISEDPRLFDTLGKIVAEGVRREGFFVVDLQDFALSVETAKAIAAVAGVEVSAGTKAVFGPRTGGTAEN